MNEPLLETTNLSRNFGRKAAVSQVDMQLHAGTLVGLIGANGAGKTTLLNLLSGLLEPTSGTADLFGNSVRNLSHDISRQVLVVGDRHEPPGYARIKHLVDLQAEASLRFDMSLAIKLLAERKLMADMRFGSLSKGQRRWVLATLALAAKPKVLLMDEPVDGLDPEARRQLYDLLRQLVSEQNALVVVSSHVLSELERVADEIVVLKHGTVCLQESLESLRDEIREIEIPSGVIVPDWLPSTKVLAEQEQDGERQFWVRLTAEQIENDALQTDSRVQVRNVNLESLYLAIASESVHMSDVAESTEVLTCK